MSPFIRKRMVSSPSKHSALSGTAAAARQDMGNERNAGIDQEDCVIISDSDEQIASTVAGRHARAVDAREKDLVRFRTILSGQGHVHEQPTTSASMMANETSRKHDGMFEKLYWEHAESEHPPSASSHTLSGPIQRTTSLTATCFHAGHILVRIDFYPRADSIKGYFERSAPDAGAQGLQSPSAGNGDGDSNGHLNASILTIEDNRLPRKRRKLSNSTSLAGNENSFYSRQHIVKETPDPTPGLTSSSSTRGDDGSLPTDGTNSSDPVTDAVLYYDGIDTTTKAQKTGVHQGIVHLIMANSRRRYDEFEGELSLPKPPPTRYSPRTKESAFRGLHSYPRCFRRKEKPPVI